MRLNNQVLSLFIALVISFVFVAKSSAQGENKGANLLTTALKSIDKDGRPSEKSWRGNLQDFSISKGKLSLNSPNAFGQRLLFTSVQLGKELTWSGKVSFDKLPTSRNYAYILLSDLPQYQKEEKGFIILEYLALNIGGKARRDISLVTLRLKLKGKNIKTAGLQIESERTLIKSPNFSNLEESLEFSFKVSYNYNQAKLSLDLTYPDKPAYLSKIRTIDWQEIKPQENKNSFGFLINHTKEYRQAMHFDKLCITNGIKTNNSEKPVDKPQEKEQTEENAVDKAIILSEVMPNPKQGSAEYIELYNPNNKAIDLTPYQIGISSNSHNIRKVGLRSAGSIPANSYLVLSTNPESILENYPSCPKDLAVQVSLPQMNNKGCYIYLYKDRELIDGVHYNPKKLTRGFQSKKGLAWEREGLEHSDKLDEISWHIGAKTSDYASPGLANSKGNSNELSPTTSKSKKDKNKKSVQGDDITLEKAQALIEKDKDIIVEVKLYDLMGVLLYQNKNEQAKTFLAQPFAKKFMLNNLNIPNSQLLIAIITLSKSKEKTQTLRLKGFYP